MKTPPRRVVHSVVRWPGRGLGAAGQRPSQPQAGQGHAQAAAGVAVSRTYHAHALYFRVRIVRAVLRRVRLAAARGGPVLPRHPPAPGVVPAGVPMGRVHASSRAILVSWHMSTVSNRELAPTSLGVRRSRRRPMRRGRCGCPCRWPPPRCRSAPAVVERGHASLLAISSRYPVASTRTHRSFGIVLLTSFAVPPPALSGVTRVHAARQSAAAA
jgi:hypothetical protein